MRRAALAAFGVGLVVVLAVCVVPWFTKARDFPASIPSPPGLTSIALDVVPPGQTLCSARIAAEQHSREARIQVGTYGKPGPALRFTLTGPGYRSAASQPAGWADNSILRLPITPPPRPEVVTACIANRGKVKIAVYSGDGRSKSRATADVGPRALGPTPSIGFWERKPVSIADRASLTVDRMATFRGFLGHTWILWPLFVLFALGLPAGLALAIWRGFPR